MADHARIEDLRRRVQKDPASIAFAQLAEEYRRAGRLKESIDTCRAGLVIHPAYLSARVTLGRALIELGELEEAKSHLELVLASAHENLAAIRGLAEIYHRLGQLEAALAKYKLALSMARYDPDLEETVAQITRELAPDKRRTMSDGLSFAEIREQLLNRPGAQPPVPWPEITRSVARPAESPVPVPTDEVGRAGRADVARLNVDVPLPAAAVVVPQDPPAVPAADSAPARVARTTEALEQWLTAVHAARADQHA